MNNVIEELTKRQFEINIKFGMHARPAAVLIQIINNFKSDVLVEKDGQTVNGRSILGILSLGAEAGAQLKFAVSGDDADVLIEEIEKFFEGRSDYGK